MKLRTLFFAGLAAGALSANAFAATPGATAAAPAAPTQAPIPQGPTIPGFCTFSFDGIVANSKVGQAVVARMKVLEAQVKAELQPEYEGISTEGRTIEGQRATMDAATYQARAANLQLRATQFDKRQQQRSQELQATQQKELEVVQTQMDPVLRQAYVQRQCSILLNRDSGAVAAVSPAMDLTPIVVAGLDQKIQTLTFDRVTIDPQTGAVSPASAGR